MFFFLSMISTPLYQKQKKKKIENKKAVTKLMKSTFCRPFHSKTAEFNTLNNKYYLNFNILSYIAH